ncbi:MAG: redoxin domain-containing protein [Planctomycetota bacterium]|jgi:peroxiredoxin
MAFRLAHLTAVMVAGLAVSLVSTAVAQTPTPDFALQYKPALDDVEYDTPAAADVQRCRVELERSGTSSGFAVFDPTGVILRRYVDTNGDRYIDQWRYFRNGIEVYRDIDTNKNNRVDQSRWLNTGGSRWAILNDDENDDIKDGSVERWKQLSAEEASRVAISAMARGDADLLTTILISEADVQSLGIDTELQAELLKNVQEPEAAMRTVLAQNRSFGKQSQWQRFDAAMPGVIPADEGKASVDLMVYEGAMAIVQTGSQHGFVTLGEMVLVGDVWKLTQIPQPAEGQTVTISSGGVLMRQAVGGSGSGTVGLSKEMQQLITELQQLDQQQPAPDAAPTAVVGFLGKRNAILERLAREAGSGADAETWQQQLINGLASSLQVGDASARGRMAALRSEIRKKAPNSSLIAYLDYRQMMAQFGAASRAAKSAQEQQKVQDELLKALEDFAKANPDAEDAPDALLQIAMNAEFTGLPDDARKWYGELATKHSQTPAGQRAAGALKRIGLTGQPLTLSGPDATGREVNVKNYKGRVVLVVYWASWSQQFNTDLVVLKALHEQYSERGLQIVGVNLDQVAAEMTAFAQKNRMTWPNIFQPGALDAPLAQEYGILTVPTMLLVDRSGRVVSNNVTVNDLKERLAEMFRSGK